MRLSSRPPCRVRYKNRHGDVNRQYGAAIVQPAQGSTGAIDVFLSAPGVVVVELGSAGVPGGTTLDVRAKARQTSLDPSKSRTRITNRGDDTASTAAIAATVQILTVRLRPLRTSSPGHKFLAIAAISILPAGDETVAERLMVKVVE